MSSLRETTIGLIGFGEIGKKCHGPALREKYKVYPLRLVGIGDVHPQDIYPDVMFVEDYRDLLKRNDIDAISIATPPNTHYQIAIDALRVGKHVMVEKPPALTMEQLNEMEKVAEDVGVVLFTAFHTRYRDEVVGAKEYLVNQDISEIEIVRFQNVHNYHDTEKGWIFNKEIGGGGIVMDDGSNFISSTLGALGDNADFTVTSVRLGSPPGIAVETNADVNFLVNKHVRGSLKMNWLHEGDEVGTITIRTLQDECVIDLVKSQLLRNGKPIIGEAAKKQSVFDMSIEYQRVYADFAQAIADGICSVRKKELQFVLDVYKQAG